MNALPGPLIETHDGVEIRHGYSIVEDKFIAHVSQRDGNKITHRGDTKEQLLADVTEYIDRYREEF
jgi:hypothetical protein